MKKTGRDKVSKPQKPAEFELNRGFTKGNMVRTFSHNRSFIGMRRGSR